MASVSKDEVLDKVDSLFSGELTLPDEAYSQHISPIMERVFTFLLSDLLRVLCEDASKSLPECVEISMGLGDVAKFGRMECEVRLNKTRKLALVVSQERIKELINAHIAKLQRLEPSKFTDAAYDKLQSADGQLVMTTCVEFILGEVLETAGNAALEAEAPELSCEFFETSIRLDRELAKICGIAAANDDDVDNAEGGDHAGTS
jgi:predicted aspartyl protease